MTFTSLPTHNGKPRYHPRPQPRRSVIIPPSQIIQQDPTRTNDPSKLHNHPYEEVNIVLKTNPSSPVNGDHVRQGHENGPVHEIKPRTAVALNDTTPHVTKYEHSSTGSNCTSSCSSPVQFCLNEQSIPNYDLQPARPRLQGLGMSAIAQCTNPVQVKTGDVFAAPPRCAPHSKGSSATNVRSAPLTAQSPPHNSTPTTLAVPQRAQGQNPSPIGFTAPHSFRNEVTLSVPPQVVLPDLFRVADAAVNRGDIVRPPAKFIDGLQITEPFSLEPPTFTDADIPLPEPYNTAYPHPLTAYASPGVNRQTVRQSGYDTHLAQLVKNDPEMAIGSIFYSAGHRNLESSVYLCSSVFHDGSDGNTIAENICTLIERRNKSHLPLGVAGVSPFAVDQMETQAPAGFAPRFLNGAHLSAQRPMSQHRQLEQRSPSRDHFDKDTKYYVPQRQSNSSRSSEYDLTPRPSPDQYGSDQYARREPFTITRTSPTVLCHPSAQPAPYHYREMDLRDRSPPHDSWNPQEYTNQFNDLPEDQIPYQAEICLHWAQTGSCPWQDGCLYPHHFEHLTPSGFLTTAIDNEENYNRIHPREISSRQNTTWAGHSHPTPDGHTSLTTARPPIRPEPRRASCPTPRLAAVPEMEDTVSHPPPQRRQSHAVPAPIGAGRPLPTAQMMSGLGNRSPISTEFSTTASIASTPSFGWKTHDENILPVDMKPRRPTVTTIDQSCMPRSSVLPSTPSLASELRSPSSSLSLSTSSSSRVSEISPKSASGGMPFNGGYVGQGGDFDIGMVASGSGNRWKVVNMSRTTSLDFSTGKSIWN